MSAQNAQMAEAMATQTFMIQYLWEKIKAPQVKEEGEEEGRGSYLRSQTASVCCRARGPAVKLIF